MTGREAKGAFNRRKLWMSRGSSCAPERAEAEGAAGTSALADGSNTSVSALVLASESLWWDNLSGSSWEETAAKAATAMAERGRWRCPEKEAIVGRVEPNLSAGMILLYCDRPRRKPVHVIYVSAACPA